MQINETQYVPVWQTWSLIRSRGSANPAATTGDAPAVVGRNDLRERMQIARIQNRMTVHDLAQRVQCDVEMLARFERGDGLLPDEVQRRICAEFRIS